MVRVETRCCYCSTENTNDEKEDNLQFGTGRRHGTEYVYCEECDEVTLQNRRGASVPTEGGKDNF